MLHLGIDRRRFLLKLGQGAHRKPISRAKHRGSAGLQGYIAGDKPSVMTRERQLGTYRIASPSTAAMAALANP
jgi:hypothetical protein